MKASELRGRDVEDLQNELRRLQEALFNLTFNWQSQENPDAGAKLKLRHDIARVKTVLREKELQPGSR